VKLFIAPFAAILGIPLMVQAASVAVSTDRSSSSNTVKAGLGLSTDDFEKKADPKKETFFDMNLSYSATDAKSTDTAGTVVDDKSTNFYGDFAWTFINNLRLGFGVATSTESADNIYGTEGSLLVGYSYVFQNGAQNKDKSKDKNSDDSISAEPLFDPSVGLKLKAGKNTIRQRTHGKKSATALAVQQSWQELLADADIVKWLSLYASYRKYTYDQDINQLLSSLDFPRVQKRVGTAFSNDLSSFQEDSASVGIVVHAGDYDFDLSHSQSKEIATSAIYTDNYLNVLYFYKKWVFSMGGGASKTSDSDETTGYATLGLKFLF
jgi:hypothetical protein